MGLHIMPMSQKDAEAIAEWEYEDPYSFYNAKSDEEDLVLLLSENARNNVYFSVYDKDELIGFFTFEVEASTVEIGLGLKPEKTGKGFGKNFLIEGIDFTQDKFGVRDFSLAVATFNKRAIKLYEKVGFKRDHVFMQKTNGSEYEFLRMTYSKETK